jgi:predicted DNA-binding ribbon-helix-helix protein
MQPPLSARPVVRSCGSEGPPSRLLTEPCPPLTAFAATLGASISDLPLSYSSTITAKKMAQVTKSQRRKRNLVLAGKKTSIALEDGFWSGLEEIAASRAMTVSELIAVINKARNHSNLSSAIRLFVLGYYRSLSNAKSKEF